MVREAKKGEAGGEPNPEAIERKRLKGLAFSTNILSEIPGKSHVHLNPSKTVVKHHGKDILRKSQRKNRFLFSFPGLIAPIGGGKIGELKDLGTKNPILYLDFPQGQMKLFGTIVYPKNRYLTLQFSRGGKNAICEDYFDNMIVFSDAWWIGTKDENPEEARLEFPKELYEGQQAEYDFKGGAGAASVVNQGVSKTRMQCAEQQSPKTPTEGDLSDSENDTKDLKEVVPVRHSERTTRKSYKFADTSSDDSPESSPDLYGHEEKKQSPCTVIVDDVNEDAVEEIQLPKENKMCASGSMSKKVSQVSSTSATKEVSSNNRGSLVQATISTLFKKVEEKKAPRTPKKISSSKDSSKKLQQAGSERNIDLDEGSRKRAKKSKDKDPSVSIVAKGEKRKVEDDDDIEEVPSDPEDMDGSDEDWTA